MSALPSALPPPPPPPPPSPSPGPPPPPAFRPPICTCSPCRPTPPGPWSIRTAPGCEPCCASTSGSSLPADRASPPPGGGPLPAYHANEPRWRHVRRRVSKLRADVCYVL